MEIRLNRNQGQRAKLRCYLLLWPDLDDETAIKGAISTSFIMTLICFIILGGWTAWADVNLACYEYGIHG